MLACTRHSVTSSSAVMPLICTFNRRYSNSFDPIQQKMEQKRSDKPGDVEKDETSYSTKPIFEKNVKDQRYQGADSESGRIPTKLQRYYLVITRLYKSQADIPQYVHAGTMYRMHSRMRVVYIIAVSITFISFFYTFERINYERIDRDRKKGVSLTKIFPVSYTKMGIFRNVFMAAAGIDPDTDHHEMKRSYDWKKEHLPKDKLILTENNKDRYPNVPAIPTDISMKCGIDIEGKKKNGVFTNATSNPGVILGMGLTTVALLGMFRSSFLGDKLGAQKFMQYRIMAQFFTVTALVAGVTIFGASYSEGQKSQSATSGQIAHTH